ncbi:MAG: cytochrome c oxidase subunit 3 [Saprospiraceae bacterium]
MSTETIANPDYNPAGDSWSGGKSPFKISYGKLMMWYFLLSDAFTFAGFLIAYGALRFSMPTWPVPDFVFSTLPFDIHHKPLIFVTIMTFVLILSSVTMVRAVQEGHRNNTRGIIKWMALTIVGGLSFLGCQAWEWTTLIGGENMTVTTNPFGRHLDDGVYVTEAGIPMLDEAGKESSFKKGDSYLIHKHHDEWDFKKFKITSGEAAGQISQETFGPKAFGALFFSITGFHGFHVFSGVVFLLIIMINVASGLYKNRQNGNEMVEKIGLYWHFVDLVWVFVFLVFYLL